MWARCSDATATGADRRVRNAELVGRDWVPRPISVQFSYNSRICQGIGRTWMKNNNQSRRQKLELEVILAKVLKFCGEIHHIPGQETSSYRRPTVLDPLHYSSWRVNLASTMGIENLSSFLHE